VKCREWNPLIAGYVAGDLDGTKAELVEAHLARCGRCRRELKEVRRLSQMFADPERVPTSFRERLFGVQGKVEMPAKLPLAFAALMILGAIGLWYAMPDSGIAAHERMRAAVARAGSLHFATSTLDSRTGRWEPLETWVAYGCFRRGSRYHIRQLRGANGVASFDPRLGEYTSVWHPTKGRYVPAGALLASSAEASDSPKRPEVITVESLLKSELPWAKPQHVIEDVASWHGKRCITLTIDEERSAAGNGGHTRTMFVVDRQTNWPLFSEVTQLVAGRWRSVAKTKFDFDADLPREMFTIESLQHSYAKEVASIQ
jgi:hypothetical protein